MGYARSMLRALKGSVLFAASLALAGCNLVFGIEGPAGDGVCPPEKPGKCEEKYQSDAENCCAEGRSCQGGECVEGKCQSTPMAQSGASEEGLSIVMSGDRVMWSSGYGRSIYRTNLDGGGITTLVSYDQTDFEYITMLAVDPEGEYVYFTDYGSHRIGRVSVEDGQPITFAEVPDSMAPGAKGGFGRILVHGEHIYWAMDFQQTMMGSSHIWRAPRDPQGSLPVQAEMVVQNEGAFGLVGDDEYLYFGDNIKRTIERLRWEEAGQGTAEVLASSQDSIGELAVDNENIYWATYHQVRYQKKDVLKGSISLLPEVDSYIWGIVSDGRDLYFSSVGDSDKVTGKLWRAPRGSGVAADNLFEPPVLGMQAKGISSLTEDCDTVYFLIKEGGLVRKMTK